MKTLRLFVAVGLLLGSFSIGMAQSNSDQNFKSDAEKQAWINQNTDEPSFSSEEEKEAWIQANPAKYEASQKKAATSRANVQISKVNANSQTRVRTTESEKVVLPANAVKATGGLKSAKTGAKVNATRVNNTSKALPADYKPAANETKTDK